MITNKKITDIHIGLDLSLKGTGMTIYMKNENLRKIKFFRIVYDKSVSTILFNVNQIRLKIPQLLEELDLNYFDDEVHNNSARFSCNQMEHTKLFVSMVSMIIKQIRLSITENNLKHDEINLYLNMEGSILSGHDFNSQVALNMLQGLLRGDLIKVHLSDKFNQLKFRIVPPKTLKLFFTRDGSATKNDMMQSFIDNYNGRKLLPQANNDNKTVEKLNDIIDSFALVTFNVYDKISDIIGKDLFNKYPIKSDKVIVKKRRKQKTILSSSLAKNIPNITDDFLNNLDSKILKDNKIISI